MDCKMKFELNTSFLSLHKITIEKKIIGMVKSMYYKTHCTIHRII
jgi:hypothetical protein